MKKRKKVIIPAVILTGLAVGGGLHLLNVSQSLTHQSSIVSAYTSPTNQQEPATAPDSYKINFTDNNLKQALNKALRDQLSDPARPLDSDITAGEAKQVSSLQGPRTLDKSNITNLEGLQYFVNLKLADINENQIADLAPIADLPLLDDLRLNDNPNITDISPLKNLPKLKKLQFGRNKVTNFSALSAAPMLEELQINSVQGTLDLASLSGLNKVKFLNLNGNGLKSDSFGPIKNLPALNKITIGGNSVVDLREMLKGGFNHLGNGTQLNNQYYSTQKLALNQTLFPNPLKTPDGKTVPVSETAKIKNANADGTLNPNGDHIKLMAENFADSDFGDNKQLKTSWDTRFNHGNMTNQQFHGKSFVINYNIKKDITPPTITPNQPAKIVSRKGKTINLSDVTAEDNEGGSGLKSLTNNAVAQGLDVNNPAKGDYTITYTATDNQNNTATVTRQVEITDADDLQQAINQATTELTKGYTLSTKEKVTKKKQAAEAIIAQNDATQAQIDQALAELVEAINKLEVDTWKLVAAVTNKYNKAPDYIQQDPAVQAALTEANNVLNDPNKTPEAVDTAANNLINALNNAERAEADRQTEATNALKQIEGDDKKANRTSNAIQDVKTKINAIKDGTKRNALLKRLQTVEKAYNDQKNALDELIANAKKPEITEGMSGTTVVQLQTAIQNAEATSTNANSSQEALETAINTLQMAIDNLRADKTELEALINSVSAEPDYIKNDPEVVAKKAEAERVKNLPNPTVAEIKKAVRELTDALRAARQAEQDRQTEAIALLTKAETDKTVYVFDQAEAKINEIKDTTVKNALTIRLQAAQQAYDNAKTALQNKITIAENPTTTDAMTAESVARLQQAIAQAKNALADKTPQQTIEVAHAKLDQAITQLEVDATALDQAIAEHATLPDYIQTDPAVVTAKAEADRVKALPSPTKAEVQQAVSGLKNAIRNAKQAEQTRQDQAQQQIDQTATNLSPATITTAQAKIDDVKDTVKKAELQAKLDNLKQKLANQKQALRDLIAKAQDPDTVDGMTDATKNALIPKINGAITVRDDDQASSAQIEAARQALQQAIDNLRADKTDLENALAEAEAEPEYLKGKDIFRRALEGGRATRDNPNPTIAEVRNAVLALRNAKLEAVLQETQAQQAMDEALQKAQEEIDKLPTLPGNQLLNIDIASLERLFDQVDEPVKKAELRNKLDVVKNAYNKRKAEVEARYPKSPNTGYQKQTNISPLIALLGLPVATIAVIIKKFKRQ